MLPDDTRESSWDSFRDEFMAGYFAVDPHFAVQQGRHEFDGLLPDWSPAGLQRGVEFLKTSRERAMLFDAAALNERLQFERDYLLAVIDGALFWMQDADWPHRNPFYYADRLDPNVYVSREYAPLDERLRAYTRWASR